VGARFTVATLVLAGYLLAARGVGDLYPLSTYSMYAGSPGDSISRVMALVGGSFVEVTDLSSWQCDNLPHLEAAQCGGARGIAYLDREREAHIRNHPGDGGEPVELVRRVFSFDGVQRPAYCTLARCRARR
jgi:hypothetical protein